MGSYVSLTECEEKHGIVLKCDIEYTDATNSSIEAIGELRKGEFEGDPDIAGVGIFATFITVSSIAVLCSCVNLVYRFYRWRQRRDNQRRESINPYKLHGDTLPGPLDFLESIVLSCSDTQVFSGGAYAVTLRYFRGCTVTAYHYNIVANMMLLTCATHLMSVTVVRDYWKHPILGFVRVIFITLLFFVTGLLLANQNADTAGYTFPTKIPNPGEEKSLLFMAAACFQSQKSQFVGTVDQTFATPENFKSVILESTPGNTIMGWDKFIFMWIWYGLALVVEIFNFLNRGSKRGGRRARFTNAILRGLRSFTRYFLPCFIRRTKRHQHCAEYTPLASPAPYEFQKMPSQRGSSTRDSVVTGRVTTPGGIIEITEEEFVLVTWMRKFGKILLSVYLIGGVGLSVWTVIESGTYMNNLRLWVAKSGWLVTNDDDITLEDDPTTFGQLVPIWFITMRNDQKYQHVNHSLEGGQSQSHRPPDSMIGSQMSNINEAFENKRPGLAYTKLHSSALSSSPPTIGFMPDTPTPQLGAPNVEPVTTQTPMSPDSVGPEASSNSEPVPSGSVSSRPGSVAESQTPELSPSSGASTPRATSVARPADDSHWTERADSPTFSPGK